jgi:REP element-mobilizing transposase RayT
MAQSLAKLWVHLIFSTKHREPWLTDAVRAELHPYLARVFQACDSETVVVGSAVDHVHALFELPRTMTLAQVVEEVKVSSSKWLKGKVGPSFGWQAGYGAFSVSASQVRAVRAYVEGQAEHHRVKTFQEEFRAFLRRYQVKCDERYLWD